MSGTAKSDVQAAIDAGRELAIKPEMIGGTPVIFAPEGFGVHELTGLRDYPRHIEETVRHTTAASFVAYYNRYAGGGSAIFLDTSSAAFTAVLDYHNGGPDWCLHKSVYAMEPTHEWEQWKANDKKVFLQEEFGRFIENNLVEIVNPPNGEMLEVALSLQAKSNVDFSKATRLDNGQTQFQYVETIEGKAGLQGQLKVPDLFSIGLKLFEGGEAYQMDARFRYRIKDGNLSLWYELVRPHKTLEANVADTRAHIESNMAAGSFYCAAL